RRGRIRPYRRRPARRRSRGRGRHPRRNPRVSSDHDTPGADQTAEPLDDEIETIVHVLRHGEVHNPKGILYGRLPGFSLSVAGRAQAAAVARTLADHDIAAVIASPLQRAQETAAPIAEQHGLTVRTDENLIERSEEHTSELQSRENVVCRLLLDIKQLVN